MSEVVPIRQSEDPRDVIHRACDILARGGLLVVPTDTRYVMASLPTSTAAVARLVAASDGQAPGLLLRSYEQAQDYAAKWSSTAEKLGRRAWPGPVSLLFPNEMLGHAFEEFPPEVRQHLTAGSKGTAFRVTAAAVPVEILRYLPSPLVISSDLAGTSRLEEVPSSWNQTADLLLDDGPCRYQEPVTQVFCPEDNWSIFSPGVVSERIVTRLASEMVLFVCTGNTCRSPMAEALLKRRLSHRLNCADDELVDRGFVVMSAGVAAAAGAPASREAVDLLAQDGIDLRTHGSTPLTNRLLDHADHVLTMTAGHRYAILGERPDLERRVQLLAANGTDIVDPIGGGPDDYRSCREEIDHELNRLVDQLIAKVQQP